MTQSGVAIECGWAAAAQGTASGVQATLTVGGSASGFTGFSLLRQAITHQIHRFSETLRVYRS